MNIRAATVRGPRRRSYRPSPVGKRSFKAKSSTVMHFSRLEIAGVVAAMVLFGLGMWTSYEVRNIAQDISALSAQRVEIETRHNQMLKEKSGLLRSENLMRIGRKLGLHVPEASQVVTLR